MIAAVTGTVLVAAVVITIIVGIVRGGGPAERRTDPESASGNISGVSAVDKPFVSDFMLLEDNLEETFTGYVRSREPMDSWSMEMVDKYRVDPEIIAIEHMEKEAEKVIRDIFADVP